jgi:hypothetical protein
MEGLFIEIDVELIVEILAVHGSQLNFDRILRRDWKDFNSCLFPDSIEIKSVSHWEISPNEFVLELRLRKHYVNPNDMNENTIQFHNLPPTQLNKAFQKLKQEIKDIVGSQCDIYNPDNSKNYATIEIVDFIMDDTFNDASRHNVSINLVEYIRNTHRANRNTTLRQERGKRTLEIAKLIAKTPLAGHNQTRRITSFLVPPPPPKRPIPPKRYPSSYKFPNYMLHNKPRISYPGLEEYNRKRFEKNKEKNLYDV